MTLSTPSKHKLARNDKAGNQLARLKDLATTLLEETSVAQVCDFDDFLRAFVFRCLRDEFSLETLQDEIEKLERSDLDEGQTSDRLHLLQKERHDALQDYLEQCLTAVLPLANDESIRKLLSEYLTSFSSVDRDRYAPYVNLCNKALSLLKNVHLPLRSPTATDLQYRRLDPSVFKSHTETDNAHRKPDVGKAGEYVVKALGSALDKAPDKGAEPEFDSFFGLEEFKAIGSPSEQACVAIKEAFATTSRRVHVRQQDNEIDEVHPSPVSGSSPSMSAVPPSTPPATGSRPSKRKLEATNNLTSGKKLCLGFDKEETELRKESSNSKNFDGRVQCAAYALEMLSQNPGIQHTINLLHIDDCLFIWYFDREGIVRSNGISFIADFPRALVLIALFQRFTPEDWGRNETFNCPPNTASFNVSLDDPLLRDTYNPRNFQGLKIKCSDEDYLSPRPRCLGGRATRVLPCEPKLKDGARLMESLIVKISHPEARRTHEGKTMRGIRNIANKYDASMTDHLPELLYYADVHGTDTGRIRSLIRQPGNGYRIMRILAMKRLEKISSLDAPSFIRAWLDAVTCHAFLWKHGVEHGDPSLYNIMCHPETHRGVLTDFDLSILQWEDRVPGCDRMGTVPFMAFELLKEGYWSGDIIRYYHHELEAFIWCLPFMCLGGFVADSKCHRVIADWVKASPEECRGMKTNFSADALDYSSYVPPSFAACYQLAIQLCYTANDAYTKFSRIGEDDEDNDDDNEEHEPSPATRSLGLWTEFLGTLKKKKWQKPKSTSAQMLDAADIASLIKRLESHQPYFDGLDADRRSELQESFIADSEPPALRLQAPKLKDRMKGRQDPSTELDSYPLFFG
ncbi:hypothetical protein CCMSSC00406_0010270 [Pleurotus cornucopiae]|uniref:Uncharacterized protein n=1 Tax=Pleurotus cornucopiae TaxID=5321 RepID=A0ACB7IIA0_PLECO|nr:hypothetical protein CCMSSC00406_0010270 [Pleurotus cornucopiae]